MDSYFESLKNSVQDPDQANNNKPVESSEMATLTVKVDVDCKLFCDGDFLDLFEANKVKKIPIEVGQHLITIESEHYEGVSEDQVVDASEAGKNYLLLVNDMKQKEKALLQEQEIEIVKKRQEEKKIEEARKAEEQKKTVILLAEAEAQKQKLLRDSSNQTVINLKWIEKWDGHLPQYMLGEKSGAMIMLKDNNK